MKSMKKYIVVIMLAIAGATAAQTMELNDYKVLNKLNNETTFNSLIRYLEANEDQIDQLKYVFTLTERKLEYANKKTSLVAAEKALMFNLGNAKYILTEEQYRKYLRVLNVSRYSIYDEYMANNQ
jgi:esterase/lipase